MFAITAQTDEKVESIRSSLGLTFPIISDPEAVLAAYVRSEFNLNIAIAERSDFKHGIMTQPAVLIVNNDADILYSWASEPTLSNVMGGSNRPVFKEIWASVMDRLAGRSSTRRISVHGFFSATGGLF